MLNFIMNIFKRLKKTININKQTQHIHFIKIGGLGTGMNRYPIRPAGIAKVNFDDSEYKEVLCLNIM